MDVFMKLPAYMYQHIIEDLILIINKFNMNLSTNDKIDKFILYRKHNEIQRIENWLVFELNENSIAPFMPFFINGKTYKFISISDFILDDPDNNKKYKEWEFTVCYI